MPENNNEQMKTFKFGFKINPVEYAKRFGIQLPDDSMDNTATETATDECCATDEAIAEDADISVPSSLYGQCQATLAQCKAKNPLTCPYHGMKAISMDIEASLRNAGISGDVNVEVVDVINGIMSLQASVVAPESDEQKVRDAMKNFFAIPGVNGDPDFFLADNGKVEGIFDIDSFDPNAKAKWSMGQGTIQQNAQPASAPAPAPQPQQQATAAPTRAKPTRKRKSATTTPVSPTAEAPVPQPEQQGVSATVSEQSSSMELPDDDTPILFPGVAPKDPPKYISPFNENELATLRNAAERIWKTIKTLNKHVKNGDIDTYLQGNGNGQLPARLAKYKNQIVLSDLQDLEKKDTQGQVSNLVKAAEAINASEVNGWKDYLDFSQEDLAFDTSKYKDPYEKEREAFKSYIPGSKGRERDLNGLREVEKSKAKDAPKNAAEVCRESAGKLTDLEEGYEWAKKNNVGDELLNAIGRAYYVANKRFVDALKECKNWQSKQWLMQDSIKETIKAYENRGITVPDELSEGWQEVEDQYEDAAWRVIANHFGFNVADKAKHMAIFKKNMKAAAQKCTTHTLIDTGRVWGLLNGTSNQVNANTNSYVPAAKAVFGSGCNKWQSTKNRANGHAAWLIPDSQLTPGQLKARKGMHIYAVTSNKDAKDVEDWAYGACCAIIVDNRKVVKALFNDNGSSAGPLVPHRNYCNVSLMSDCNCTAVSYNPYNVSKNAFTEDLSDLPADKLWNKIGITNRGAASNETWIIGGIHFDQIKAIKYFTNAPKLNSAQKDRLRSAGISVYDRNGNIVFDATKD